MQEYFLGFSLFPGIGSVLFGRLLQECGSVQDAWHADPTILEAIIGEKKTAAFIEFRKTIDLDVEQKKLQGQQISFVSQQADIFPLLLKTLAHPPIGIYVKGDVSVLSLPKSIGIVGTRKVTLYGKQVTEMLTRQFVAESFVVISGLALGVDGIAHKTCLDMNGKTIAVLGCGVDICVPSSHQYLYDKIVTGGGCVVSTFPPGHQSTKGLFPARNALIAGLSQAVVVTEGAADSGALITAQYAEKMGRPVFAVPGPITSSLSQGTFSLLKKGAFPVSSAHEVLDRLGILETPKAKVKTYLEATAEEQEILDLLVIAPLHFDEIVRKIKRDSKTVGSLLIFMELKGLVKNEDGMYHI